MRSENIGICLEEPPDETLEGDEVDVRVGIKVDLNATLLEVLRGIISLEIERAATYQHYFTAHFFLLFVGLFSL
jgi:hypothetical protein